MRTGAERTGGQPHRSDAASSDLAFVIYLASQEQAAHASEALVISKSRGGGRRQIGGRARASRTVREIQPGTRTHRLNIVGGIRGGRRPIVRPLQNWAGDGSGPQHPLPVVALDTG